MAARGARARSVRHRALAIARLPRNKEGQNEKWNKKMGREKKETDIVAKRGRKEQRQEGG